MKFCKTLMLISAIGLAVGCAALQDGSVAAKTAIQVAALKVIDEDPERAQRVYEIAGDVEELVGGDSTTTMDALEQRVRSEIRWDRLDTAERLVASNLVDAVRAEIEARIDGGSLDPGDRVAIGTVMQWIQEAAAMAGGGDSADAAGAEAVAGASAVRHGRGSGPPPAYHARA